MSTYATRRFWDRIAVLRNDLDQSFSFNEARAVATERAVIALYDEACSPWFDASAFEGSERLRKENTILRGLIQCNPDWKCSTYGYLGADGEPLKSMGQCPLGFPGCSCGDDLLCAYCEPKGDG